MSRPEKSLHFLVNNPATNIHDFFILNTLHLCSYIYFLALVGLLAQQVFLFIVNIYDYFFIYL